MFLCLLLVLVTQRYGFAFTRRGENRLTGSDLRRDRELHHTDLFGQHHRDELLLATAENLHQVRWACVYVFMLQYP